MCVRGSFLRFLQGFNPLDHFQNVLYSERLSYTYIYMLICNIYICILDPRGFLQGFNALEHFQYVSYIEPLSHPYMCADISNTYMHTVCCSVLQCVAVCCSVLQCVAVLYAGISNTYMHTEPLSHV